MFGAYNLHYVHRKPLSAGESFHLFSYYDNFSTKFGFKIYVNCQVTDITFLE